MKLNLPIPGQSLLNYGNLVNRACPLNRGLGSWWPNLPQRGKGNTFFDIAGRNHGTLTNGPTWVGALGRPGGFGSIATVAGSSQYAGATIPGADSATAMSIECWMYRSSASDTPAFGFSGGNSAPGNNRFSAIWYSDGNIYVSCEAASPNFASAALAGTGWRHACLTYDGAIPSCLLYIDGLPLTLSAFSSTIPSALGSGINPFTVGRDSSDRYGTGNYDGALSFPGLTLSASAVYARYTQSLRGNALTWNRVRRATVSSVAAAAVFARITGERFGLAGKRGLAA